MQSRKPAISQPALVDHLEPLCLCLQAELAAARDSEPNPEELEKYIKERFGGRR